MKMRGPEGDPVALGDLEILHKAPPNCEQGRWLERSPPFSGPLSSDDAGDCEAAEQASSQEEEKWAKAQSDKPKLSDAIRRLVELGLKIKQPKG
jgi:hypothetical protein